jgi:hypothetical protein
MTNKKTEDEKTVRSAPNANKPLLVAHLAKYKSLAKKAVDVAFDSYDDTDVKDSVRGDDDKLLELQNLISKLSQDIQALAVKYDAKANADAPAKANASTTPKPAPK